MQKAAVRANARRRNWRYVTIDWEEGLFRGRKGRIHIDCNPCKKLVVDVRRWGLEIGMIGIEKVDKGLLKFQNYVNK